MKKLVIAVDIDDDLGRKAKTKGPLIGSKDIVDAATRLALADPEDPDANALFKAVKLANELKGKGEDMEVVALTGHKNLGVEASSRVAAQLDMVLQKVSADSALLVTDGAEDETVLPILESRLRLDGVDVVYVKQSKELEKTYFLILEKLRDPTYAKILFGVPAVLLILISLMYVFNIPWPYVGILIGTYLIIKGFGIEERLYNFFSFSAETNPHVKILLSLILLLFILASIGVSYLGYMDKINSGYSSFMAYIHSLDILVNFTAILLLIVLGIKLIDNYTRGNPYRVLTTTNYLITTLASLVILKVTFKWILNDTPPYFSFADTVNITIVTFIISYILYKYVNSLKRNLLESLKFKNYEVYNIHGDFIGVVNKREGNTLFVKNQIGKTVELPLDNIIDVEKEKLVSL